MGPPPSKGRAAPPPLARVRPAASRAVTHPTAGARLALAQPSSAVASLPSGPLAAHADERARVSDAIGRCLADAWAPSTNSRYESALRVHAGGAELALGSDVLPMDSTDIFLFLGKTSLRGGREWRHARQGPPLGQGS